MPRSGLIILAAGASTRLGSPKQLLQFKGRSLLRHAAETALASICRPVVVVLGSSAELLEPELNGLEVTITRNNAWESGVGSSIRAGMQRLQSLSNSLDSVVLMLCDQPLIQGADLDRLCSVHEASGRGIVSSLYDGSMGVPVLFSSKYFSELTSLAPDDGAKRLIADHIEDNHSVPLPAAAFDVDTHQDYREIVKTTKRL